MHNSTFSVAQYGILSFPLTMGVKADYMARGVIVKTHTAARSKCCYPVIPREKQKSLPILDRIA